MEDGNYFLLPEDTSTPDEKNLDDTSGPDTNEKVELVMNRQQKRDLKHSQRKKNGRARMYPNSDSKCAQR
jgi:hypothetical protein